MIAPLNRLPLLRLADGALDGLCPHWLSTQLAEAARRAGHRKWWLAPHIAISVSSYLEKNFNAPCIEDHRLEAAIRAVLRAIGYPEIADVFHLSPPPARISLEEIALAAGDAYELAFFQILRTRIRDALQTRTTLEISDARQAIKLLRHSKSWSKKCSALLDEVVAAVRNETTHLTDAAIQIA